MSYAVSDAGEQDMRAEMKVLEKLNEEIDQLASEARDCGTLAPKVKRALDMAWFFAEEAMREVGRGSCGHGASLGELLNATSSGWKEKYCACCAHFREVGLSTQILRSHL